MLISHKVFLPNTNSSICKLPLFKTWATSGFHFFYFRLLIKCNRKLLVSGKIRTLLCGIEGTCTDCETTPSVQTKLVGPEKRKKAKKVLEVKVVLFAGRSEGEAKGRGRSGGRIRGKEEENESERFAQEGGLGQCRHCLILDNVERF